MFVHQNISALTEPKLTGVIWQNNVMSVWGMTGRPLCALQLQHQERESRVPCVPNSSYTTQWHDGGCASEGRVGHPLTRRLMVQSLAPPVCLPKCPQAKCDPQSKDIQLRVGLTGLDSKLSMDVWWLSVSVCWPCNMLVTCPRCTQLQLPPREPHRIRCRDDGWTNQGIL